MNNTSLYNVGFSKVGKRMQWLAGAVLTGASVFTLWAWNDGQLSDDTKFFVLCVIPLLMYGIIDESRLRLIVTETGITRHSIRTKTIDYTEITKIKIFPTHAFIMKGNWNSIKLFQGLDQRKQITAEILRRAQRFPQIKIIGKQKVIDSYLNNVT